MIRWLRRNDQPVTARLAAGLGSRLLALAQRQGLGVTSQHGHLPLIPDARTVLDVGAHRGEFARFARQQYPSATIHCFEPGLSWRAPLTEALDALGNCVLHPVALGEQHRDGVPFHISRLSDSSSLLPITDAQAEAFPGTEQAEVVEVELRTLAEVLRPDEIDRPCLMKVDVQGYELSVLEGAADRLALIDQLLIEVSFVELYEGQALAPDVIASVCDHGFGLTGVYNPGYRQTGEMIQADLLFTRA